MTVSDILFRQASRKTFNQVLNLIPRPPFISQFLPKPENLPIPLLLPSINGRPPVQVMSTPSKALDIAAPKLTRDEELYAISLTDLTKETLGSDAAVFVNGDAAVDPRASARLLLFVISNGKVPEQLNNSPIFINAWKTVESYLGMKTEILTTESKGMDSLRNSFAALSKEESTNLTTFLTDIGTKVLNKVLDRLSLSKKISVTK